MIIMPLMLNSFLSPLKIKILQPRPPKYLISTSHTSYHRMFLFTSVSLIIPVRVIVPICGRACVVSGTINNIIHRCGGWILNWGWSSDDRRRVGNGKRVEFMVVNMRKGG